jgi:methylenetetrahydrofolate reductase (NADPH)
MAFMHDKVPGIDIPQDIMNRVSSAADQAEEAYKLTVELAKHAMTLPSVRGLHVTDFRHDDSLERFMYDLGQKPRN